jgi:type IV pilus assembly protein PilP
MHRLIRQKPLARLAGLLLLASAVFHGGCGFGGDHADLRAYMDEVKARPSGRIQPLPPIEPVPPFAYQAGNLRSPFDPPVVIRPVAGRAPGVQVKPDLTRPRQYLEEHPVASLVMVGTLAQGDRTFGLVQDANGAVHRVQNGDYMGTDHGRIRQIQDAAIELVEIVPDGTGSGWVERSRTVPLGGENKG